MDTFSEALLSEKTDKIPEAYDWFAPLIGDWDCDYYDEPEQGYKRHVVGIGSSEESWKERGCRIFLSFLPEVLKLSARSPTVNTEPLFACSIKKKAVTMWCTPVKDA